ncbi:hypothetical protein F0P96_19540 [Hymenobacter busanensis]|uniref:Uncharacterized protein n=1 Tax=Hymenobacter busanensis TaxID=2607656 RepID=A0A7L5A075_9BACT|nr:hypothetical protein [Hymenobacter busanensis]KAA9325527.1 hypothetical protein F0P96_19540 [Hymenobacter busanensis]QHJ07802.1 hypothetical protein GUY19_11125 [Hymenobacter busanensis]
MKKAFNIFATFPFISAVLYFSLSIVFFAKFSHWPHPNYEPNSNEITLSILYFLIAVSLYFSIVSFPVVLTATIGIFRQNKEIIWLLIRLLVLALGLFIHYVFLDVVVGG